MTAETAGVQTRTSETLIRPPPFFGDQLLGQDPLEDEGELGEDLLLLVAREHVHHAVDRLEGGVGVQGGEDQVAGLGDGERRLDRLQVAHFADEDDVGVLAQDVLERLGEASGCRR